MEVPSSHAAQQGTLGVECEEALKSALRQPQVELVLSRLRATHQLSIEATRCVRSVFMPRTLPAMYESQHALRSPPQVRSCLLYTSPSPRDATLSRMPSSA